MAKSVRSKVKRKARAEFRRTIGTEAYNQNMTKVQEKLKDCVESQSLKSLDTLSAQLAPLEPMETEVDVMQVQVDADGPAAATESPMNLKGENKVPVKRKSKRKLKIKAVEKKQTTTKERKRPRYFCQF